MCDQQSLRSACPYRQSDQSLFLLLEYSISIKLPTDHNLMFLSLTGSSESTLVKIPYCWKSGVLARIFILSYDVASESEITPCNKIDKPLVVYRFTGNVITSITTLRT